jgi:hypothetical protein
MLTAPASITASDVSGDLLAERHHDAPNCHQEWLGCWASAGCGPTRRLVALTAMAPAVTRSGLG